MSDKKIKKFVLVYEDDTEEYLEGDEAAAHAETLNAACQIAHVHGFRSALDNQHWKTRRYVDPQTIFVRTDGRLDVPSPTGARSYIVPVDVIGRVLDTLAANMHGEDHPDEVLDHILVDLTKNRAEVERLVGLIFDIYVATGAECGNELAAVKALRAERDALRDAVAKAEAACAVMREEMFPLAYAKSHKHTGLCYRDSECAEHHGHDASCFEKRLDCRREEWVPRSLKADAGASLLALVEAARERYDHMSFITMACSDDAGIVQSWVLDILAPALAACPVGRDTVGESRS